MNLNGAVVSKYPLELPIMLLVAYTVPAFSWFASLFSPNPAVVRNYACFYFFFHFLVEAYAFILPVFRLHSYWKDPTAKVNMH